MRKSFTAVLERNAAFTSDFTTEPYEAGWAGEARWFIRVIESSGENLQLRIFAQISPDGLFWCDGERVPLVITEPGMYSLPLYNFGQWLRVRGELSGISPRVKLMIYLVLKE